MKYQHIKKGTFLSRPNRFIAYVEIDGREEKVHVKNTGRCRELLREGATVYLEKSDNEERATAYDLVAVKKEGRIVNMDSQAPNKAVFEWLLSGGLFPDVTLVKPETTFGESRFDFYIEAEAAADQEERGDGDQKSKETGGGESTADRCSVRRIYMEVKGCTLEENGVGSFPDAPSERAVKHVRELAKAKEAGYEAYLLFVVQMDRVDHVVPNRKTQPEFAEVLLEARKAGVQIIARDCLVTEDSLEIRKPLPVYLSELDQIPDALLDWYSQGRRILPWREDPAPYHVWLSEIMLQQTRVEAVKPYYDRFLRMLPDIAALAEAEEEALLKLWEGLGYYNRVRNLQKAAKQIMTDYNGQMPADQEELKKLPGIGSYTAGAIASIAYGKRAAAVDGNVLRVLSRVRLDARDILDAKVKKAVEQELLAVIPAESPGDFNQAMMELGAMVCLPNGKPKCEACPLRGFCKAKALGCMTEYPKKAPKKSRKTEEKTVLVLQDETRAALTKRGDTGLLAGLYEFPCLPGKKSAGQVLAYLKELGFVSLRIKKLGEAKHIFTHKEWHMTGYCIRTDELMDQKEAAERADFIFAEKEEIEKKYPLPSAYASYARYLDITQGADVFRETGK